MISTKYFMSINQRHYVIYLQNMKFMQSILWPEGAYTDAAHATKAWIMSPYYDEIVNHDYIGSLGMYSKWAKKVSPNLAKCDTLVVPIFSNVATAFASTSRDQTKGLSKVGESECDLFLWSLTSPIWQRCHFRIRIRSVWMNHKGVFTLSGSEINMFMDIWRHDVI